jgi:RNA polymerase sigma factor FliA
MYTAQGTIEKSHLLESYLPMVRRIAMHIRAHMPASVQLDDLVQAGTMGLLDACTRYQENAGAKFETFVSKRVRGAMLDELRSMDWSPRRVRRAAREIDQAIQAAGHRVGAHPSEVEIARELKVSVAQYHALLQEIQGCQLVHAEDAAGEMSAADYVDQHTRTIRQERQEKSDPLSLVLSAEFRTRLIAAIAALPERDTRLLSLYYEEELNLREIGAILEVTESRVSQLHSQAISRLRVVLKDLL